MYKTVKIGSKLVGEDQPCYVISELGGMYYEDIDDMKKMIKASADAGVDAVKIQTYKAETIALPDAEFEFEDGSRMSQYEFFKKYEISEDHHREMMEYACNLGVAFFSTPSDYADVEFLEELGMPAYKIGSDDLTNYPFLEYIAKRQKPMIVSTGMCTLGEVEEAVETILKTGNEQLILLHCTVSYPPNIEDVNLNIIRTFQQAFNIPIGYSNHVADIFIPVLAVAMGASAIEVHLTSDRGLEKPDYQVSLEPVELKKMVQHIRLISVVQGSTVKKIAKTEEKWRVNGRKSLIAARNLKSGEILKREDIKIMRPGTGFHPRDIGFLIGRTLRKDIRINKVIPFDVF
jgi:N-acetylneuraminate synthase/N,N'-diacetyllegionaminate synthase